MPNVIMSALSIAFGLCVPMVMGMPTVILGLCMDILMSAVSLPVTTRMPDMNFRFRVLMAMRLASLIDGLCVPLIMAVATAFVRIAFLLVVAAMGFYISGTANLSVKVIQIHALRVVTDITNLTSVS